MYLTLHSDYAMRVLIYAGLSGNTLARTADISDAYGISKHHLVRVVQTLAHGGFLKVQPGRSGGICLSRPPGQINMGQVFRCTEPSFRLVECFDPKRNTCPISPACRVKGILREAGEAFLAVLDQYTLADMLCGRIPALQALLPAPEHARA